MKRGSALNFLGIIFGILSIIFVICVAAVLLGRQPFRLPVNFRMNLKMDNFEDMFSTNSMEEEGEIIFEEEFDKIYIENIAGKVDITGWNEDFVKLEFVKMAPGDKYLEYLSVKTEKRGETLKIEREFTGEGISPRGRIDFRLYLPKNGIEEIEAKSVSGRLLCTNMSEETDMNLQTTSSRIGTDACDDLKIKTISGEIDFIAYGRDVEIRSTSGRIEGEYRSSENRGRIDIHTVSGSVRIVLPDDFEGKVDLRSISGTVDSEFPVQVTTSKRNSLEGNIGDGGNEIDVNTTTGYIRLMKASGDE